MKKYLKFILIPIISFFFITSCQRNTSVDPDDPDSEYVEDEDDYEIDTSNATIIHMTGDEVEITGIGAIFSDDQIIIDAGGDYRILGTLNDGQILIRVPETEKVKMVLEDVDITCSFDAPVYVEQAERAVILLKEGSDNSISDGTSYSSAEINATIYSEPDLVLSGNGKLSIDANYEDAITGKDGLIINSGEYTVSAVDDGIKGKDYLVIHDGKFNITSGGDAFKSDNENAGSGYISIDYGEFTIQAGGDALSASNELLIEDGIFDIQCSGNQSSGKGLKAGEMIQLSGGEFTVETYDDAIHSDLDILIEGGDFTIHAGDDGIHADSILTIDYADILIQSSYEGIEGKIITIAGGNITLTSSDDGINAVSATGSGEPPNPHGGGGDSELFIYGGTIIVYANGDGIDINGSVHMTDGTLIVHGPTSDGNGALDYDGSFKMDGGLLVAAGSSGMAQAPGSTSSQYSVLVNLSSNLSPGTLFHIEETNGTEILTFKPEKYYESVAFSSPELAYGASYNIYTGGSTTGTETGGLYSDGTYTPGNLYRSFTVNYTTTTIGGGGH